MKQEEIIQKATEEAVKNEDSKIEELNRDLLEFSNELQYCEKELLDLGFDVLNPEVIPQFKDEKDQIRYVNLLDTRADLIKKINTIKGDRYLFMNSQEN